MPVVLNYEHPVPDGEVFVQEDGEVVCGPDVAMVTHAQWCLLNGEKPDWPMIESPPSEFEQWCEKLDALFGDLELPVSAGVSEVGCVKEDPGDPKSPVIGVVLMCKNADGTYRKVMDPLDGGPAVDPFEGKYSKDCGPPQYTAVDCVLNDPESPYCGYPLFTCPPGTDSYVFDAAGDGWVLLDPTEHDLANSFKPALGKDEKLAKEDLTPLKKQGAFGPMTMAELFAEALAASSVVDFAAIDCDILEEHVSRCGAVSISEIDGNAGVIINDLPPTQAFNDPDGVNMANTVSGVEGCCLVVSFCARKDFVPPKIPVVTRVEGDSVTFSSPPDVADGDNVDFVDDAGTVVGSSTVDSGAGSSSIKLLTALTGIKSTVVKRVAR